MTRPNQAFFSADDEEHGYELFITDGSETGTTLVKDIAEGYWELGVEESNPCLLTPYQENLYFAANTGQLWRSDGTESGTFEVPLPDLDPFWTEILEIGVVGDYISSSTIMGICCSCLMALQLVHRLSQPDCFLRRMMVPILFRIVMASCTLPANAMVKAVGAISVS